MLLIKKVSFGSLCLILCALIFTTTSCRKLKTISINDTVSYKAKDNCNGNPMTYPCTITTYGKKNEVVLIEGFGGFDDPTSIVKMNLYKNNTYEIPKQIDVGGRTIEGTYIGMKDGTSGEIEISYIVTFDDGSSDECSLRLIPEM